MPEKQPQNKPKNKIDPSLYNLPPNSVEAEESILSAILIDNNTLLDVFDILTSEDFYKTAHKIIFSAIADLFAKTEPVDLVTLSNILKEQGQLEKIGGATYLAHLVDAVPLAVNAQHYARIVHVEHNFETADYCRCQYRNWPGRSGNPHPSGPIDS